MYGEDLLDVIIEMVLDASLSSFSPVGTVLETIVDDECFLWYADVTCSLVWEEGIGRRHDVVNRYSQLLYPNRINYSSRA